jgi:hypothetical protein
MGNTISKTTGHITIQVYDRNVHYFSYPLPCTSTVNIVDDTGLCQNTSVTNKSARQLTRTIMHIVTTRYLWNKVHDRNFISFIDLPHVIRAMTCTRLKHNKQKTYKDS